MPPHRHSQPAPAIRSAAHHPAHMLRPMSRRVRNVVFATSALLWLSGALWMALHYFFKSTTEFGVTYSPAEPSVARIHGMIGLLMLFMFGWISGTHVSVRWRQIKTHVHGLVLLIFSVTLILSGFALYYLVGDVPRTTTSIVHQLLGIVVIIIALWHWLTAPSRTKN